ncbi:MAG TPA: acetyl-CoA carboxylase, carboxyltransferase subunit beta, partial [Planctomycetota bacterium]|nr:acetyl-CoA carboxylase, carboxyltransferase subunit beta [Planctomycetota bacterium]
MRAENQDAGGAGDLHPPVPDKARGAAGDSSADLSKKRRDMPTNLWMQCLGCSKLIYKPTVEEKLHVCPECNYHFEISCWRRVEMLLDADSFEEHFSDLSPLDPLNFRALKAYKDRLVEAQRKTGLRDACVMGTGAIEKVPVAFGVSDSRFLRGSMGSVVGEKICRGVELACERSVPFVFISGSGGGARMDEGILSLMQMAKTSAALAELDRHGGLFISVLTNPTMGGAMASFAALGDVILAEPKALIGFAGPNVIRETIRSEIPEGFQTSEFLLAHGFIDRIVNREDLRKSIAYFLRMFS